jgi:hypothetical protein
MTEEQQSTAASGRERFLRRDHRNIETGSRVDPPGRRSGVGSFVERTVIVMVRLDWTIDFHTRWLGDPPAQPEEGEVAGNIGRVGD